MSNDFSRIDVASLATVVGGDAGLNQATAQVGIQFKGGNIGGSVNETKDDYRSCLDAIGRYGGKVSECVKIHEPSIKLR